MNVAPFFCHHSVVIQHLVSYGQLSWISKENVHNVRSNWISKTIIKRQYSAQYLFPTCTRPCMKHSQRKTFCFTICHTDSNQIVHPLTREHYLNAKLISMPINKYFNIFSGVQWSFSNRLLQWVWIMHRYLLTYIYISKKKIQRILLVPSLFSLFRYIDDVQRILVRSASLLDMHLEYDPTAPLSWLWQMWCSFLVV